MKAAFRTIERESTRSAQGSSERFPTIAQWTTPMIPSALPEKPSCACGGGCPRCPNSQTWFSNGEPLPGSLRVRFEAVQGADFSGVRVHPHAPDMTRPLHARAVTHGQDIYFHPGEFQPGTSAGEDLIGHELAHTQQTRRVNDVSEQVGVVSQPSDSVEQNADALARGTTTHVLAAPSGAVLRSPFDSESADETRRRERLLQSIDNAMDRLQRLLLTGGLIEHVEVAVERVGVRGVIYFAHTAGTPDEEFVTYADRDARLRRIIRSLIAMATAYRSAPITPDFSAPTLLDGDQYESIVTTPAGIESYGGTTTEWTDLQAAYARYRVAQGQTADEFAADWYYLNPSGRILPGAARGAPRIGRGTPSGYYAVVPDIDRDPLHYQRLDGFSPIPEGSHIIEFWHDDFGYYYMYHDQRIDVPDP